MNSIFTSYFYINSVFPNSIAEKSIQLFFIQKSAAIVECIGQLNRTLVRYPPD